MPGKLEGKRIAIVVTDGFEQDELKKPKGTLESEGARCDVIAPGTKGFVKGWNHTDWGDTIDVDVPIAEADTSDYDALLLPGGTMNPDKLRLMPDVKSFVRSFFAAAKPVAAICHAPWLLIDVGVVEGRKMTSWPSLQTDLVNAGAEWVDEPVVVDQGLVTSRKPGDLPTFSATLVQEFAREPSSPAQRRVRDGRPRPRPQG
ncbi:ThiJ/PfpI family protein [Labilithrix luteola]|uniref:ThiJ/PfpI family protein n=1 Tax=Labilithrix luteola TaxID=1391654 RepID=A0A0K1PPI1_9BACT|nr:type 1 glutamine amidotransferase domain-containing protein [Labilithrix luteola]AKU95422.1 ThiJ/PfpI family protein [Labilithrix luteola]